MSNRTKPKSFWTIALILSVIFACVSAGILISALLSRATQPEPEQAPAESVSVAIMDAYDAIITAAMTEAYEAVKDVPKA